MPSVLIVDDNLLARQGLKHLLIQEHPGLVFGEAGSSEDVAAILAGGTWDVVVIEISMIGQDGFQMLPEIRRHHPAARIVLLSQHANPEHASQARQVKASGYAGKNSPRAELLQAFRSVLAGKEYFVELFAEASSSLPISLHPPLSNRERDVLLGCVAGKRVGEIAAELNLSTKTVSTYKRRILDKLQLNSVADMVRHAIDHKLL
jgi:DNA-binding NarL/FixJ family response regulator